MYPDVQGTEPRAVSVSVKVGALGTGNLNQNHVYFTSKYRMHVMSCVEHYNLHKTSIIS